MKWTEQEVEFLRENYYKMTHKELGEKLGRSVDTVYWKARMCGIVYGSEDYANKRRSYKKAYNQAHKEEQRAYLKAYYQARKEKRRAYQKAYDQAHKEERKAYLKAYYQAHKEDRKAYDEAHKESISSDTSGTISGTICWECRLALQDPKEPIKCEWACKKQPVKGWQADEAQINMGNKTVVGYTVRSCPKFTAI